jgi:hypothetical protein
MSMGEVPKKGVWNLQFHSVPHDVFEPSARFQTPFFGHERASSVKISERRRFQSRLIFRILLGTIANGLPKPSMTKKNGSPRKNSSFAAASNQQGRRPTARQRRAFARRAHFLPGDASTSQQDSD